MATALTSKGRVTIPKHIREALQLRPGTSVAFSVNGAGDVVLHAAEDRGTGRKASTDRFEAVRGQADLKWRTDEVMKLLRAED